MLHLSGGYMTSVQGGRQCSDWPMGQLVHWSTDPRYNPAIDRFRNQVQVVMMVVVTMMRRTGRLDMYVL